MTATAASAQRALGRRRLSVARAELTRLLEGTGARLIGSEGALDPSSDTVRRIAEVVGRARARSRAHTFRVAVLALSKAGKSTLINALLGGDFLPSSNVPETAVLVRVEHAPGEVVGTLRNRRRVVARGAVAIRSYLRRQNARARARAGGPQPRARPPLVLATELPALTGQPLDQDRFELVDTPGPDEAGAEALRALVDRALVDADVILYVLDYGKLRTVEERRLLDRLASLRPELLRRLSERLFFVVNKVDLENSRSMPADEIRAYVADLLRAQIPALAVDAGRVLLVSAEHALLARLVRAGAADAGAVHDFERLCFGLRGSRGGSLDACAPHAGAVLEASGLPELEDRVVSFLYERRGELFVGGQLDELERHLATLDNHLRAARQALGLEHDDLARRIAGLEGELQELERTFADVEAAAGGIAERIEGWVTERFVKFRDEVDAELSAVFAARAPAGQTPPAPPGAPEVWSALAALVAEGGLDGEVAAEASARRRIASVHLRVADALRTRFASFLATLEIAAWDQQREMLAEVEQSAARLADRAGAEVGRQLGIALRPVRLAIPAPSFDDLHTELMQVGTLVARRSRSLNEHATRRVLVRTGGWCSQNAYEQRPVDVTREVTTFACDRGAVLEHWRRWARERTAASILSARAAVQARVGAAVAAARAGCAADRDGYHRTIERALLDSRRSEIERHRRAEEIDRARAHLADLLDGVARCREFLSRDAPGEEVGGAEEPR